MRDKYFIFLIVFILSSSFSVLSGQERVAFTVDRNNVMVGDLVKLKIGSQTEKFLVRHVSHDGWTKGTSFIAYEGEKIWGDD